MGQGDSPCPVGCSSWTLNNLQKEREMNIIESKIEIIEADNFSIETKYRMTMKYEGETFYWNGFLGEYGMEATWFDSEGKKTVQPDWADELEESLDKTLFDICEEKSKENEKSFDWLCSKILEVIPTATFERDDDGQIVIHTGLEEDSTGTVKKLNSDEEDDSDIYTEEVKA
jgi:hypothetical protein